MTANGYVPADLLVAVDADPKHLLLRATAARWRATAAGVQSAYGWTPTPSAGWTCYRPYVQQVYLFVSNYTTSYAASAKFDRRVWRGTAYWRKPGGVAAAIPGTSNHGLAAAIDVAGLGAVGSVKFDQFAAVAQRNGLSHSEGASVGEPWHWLDPAAATQVGLGLITVTNPQIPNLPGLPSPLAPMAREDDDMYGLLYGRSTWYLVQGDTMVPCSQADYDRLKEQGRAGVLDNATFVALRDAMTAKAAPPEVGTVQVDYDALAAALVKAGVGIDYTKMAAAVTAGVKGL